MNSRDIVEVTMANDAGVTYKENIHYSDVVSKLKKELPVAMDLLHMTLGVCGEAGELADAIKKHVIYGKDLDKANVIEEIGDLVWYLTGLQQILSITDQEVTQANATKLWDKRYPNGYSDAAAIARADKVVTDETVDVCESATVPGSYNMKFKDGAEFISVTWEHVESLCALRGTPVNWTGTPELNPMAIKNTGEDTDIASDGVGRYGTGHA